MRSRFQRAQSWILTLALIFAMAPTSYAAGGMTDRNTGVRHEVCTSLSTQAEAYYTGNYTWEALSALEGIATDSSLEAMKSPLYQSLQTLMKTTMTKSISYNSLTSYWPTTDTQPGYEDATLFYSDEDSVTGKNYNREHVWPKSRGSFYQSGAGADLHHLRPTIDAVNSTRGNATMANVRELYPNYKTYGYNGKPVLYYTDSNGYVEINDNIKGDVARIFLYVYVRWGEPNICEDVASGSLPPPVGNDDGGNNGKKVIKDLPTLLEWCQNDPVDDWEMSRNDLAEDVQGNRNVFIDYPELLWLLFSEDIPADMPTPSGEGSGSDTPSYTITPLSSNHQHGTVTLKGSRITAAPAEGYYAAEATVSPEGAATVTQSGNLFTVKGVTENCTVTVHFAPKAAAAIVYAVPEGVSVTGGGTDTGWIGDKVTLPTVSGSPAGTDQDYRFAGWVAAPVGTTSDSGSLTILSPGDSYALTAASTKLYALYSYRVDDGTGDPNTFELVTENKADWSGDYVMSGQKSATDEFIHLASGDYVGKKEGAVSLSNTGMTKTDNTLTDVTDSYVISISKLGNGNYALKLKGASSECYLSYPSGGDKNTLETAAAAETSAQWQLSYLPSGGVAVNNAGSPGRVLRFNPDGYFRCYDKGQKDVQLYTAAGASTTYYVTLSEGDNPPQPAKAATPTATPTSGSVNPGAEIKFTCATPGAKLQYKANSATSFTEGAGYTIPEDAAAGAKYTLTVKATHDTLRESDPAIFEYTVVKQPVEPDPGPGPSGGGGSGGGGGSIQTIKPSDLKENESSVTVALTDGKSTLNDAAQKTLAELNSKKPAILTGAGLSVTIPVGTLKAGADVNAIIVDPKANGNVIRVTHPDGSTSILPFAVVGDGKAAYIAKLAGSYKVIDNTKTFPDVPDDHWAAEAIGFATSHELFHGMSGGTFGASEPMTRSMLVTVLARLDSAELSSAGAFTDVPADAWYAREVAWAAGHRLVEGSGSSFNPDAPVSREQLCAILVRYMDYAGFTLEEIGTADGFSDAAAVSPWASDAVAIALKTGLLTGKGGNLIDPQGQASRAEIATLLQRFVAYTLK